MWRHRRSATIQGHCEASFRTLARYFALELEDDGISGGRGIRVRILVRAGRMPGAASGGTAVCGDVKGAQQRLFPCAARRPIRWASDASQASVRNAEVGGGGCCGLHGAEASRWKRDAHRREGAFVLWCWLGHCADTPLRREGIMF